jgi:hypothetical protein
MVFLEYDKKYLLTLSSEESLQIACVRYLRNTDLLFSSNGQAECLDTDEKGIKSYQLGYKKGMPDLIIFTPNKSYNMLVVELKNCFGSGELSTEQCKVLNNFETECKAFCCVLNSIEAFVEILTKYIHNLL